MPSRSDYRILRHSRCKVCFGLKQEVLVTVLLMCDKEVSQHKSDTRQSANSLLLTQANTNQHQLTRLKSRTTPSPSLRCLLVRFTHIY